MKKSLKLTFVVASVLMLVCTAKAANTWYVDDDNYGKEGLTGKTAELAYGTIQDAINNASSSSVNQQVCPASTAILNTSPFTFSY